MDLTFCNICKICVVKAYHSNYIELGAVFLSVAKFSPRFPR